MSNIYNSFQEASNSNWDLLVELFKGSKNFKLIKPNRINSVYDGILTTKKDGKTIAILIEVKRRQFTLDTLRNEYDNTLFLEKDKYTYLHKQGEKMAKLDPNREVKVWYLNKTRDGYYFIHDITNRDLAWVPITMNNITYSKNQTKKKKLVALLHTSDAIVAKQTNIIN